MAVGERFKKFDYAKNSAQDTAGINKTVTSKSGSSLAGSVSAEVVPSAPIGTNFNKTVFTELQNLLLEKVENIPVWFEYSKSRQLELVENFFDNKINDYPEYSFSIEDKLRITEDLFQTVSGFGKLEYFLNQNNITKILVSSHAVLIEISGKILNSEIKLNARQIEFLLKGIYYNAGIKSEPETPVINCKAGKYFVNIIRKPCSLNGTLITISKAPLKLGYGELISSKFMTKSAAEFLLSAIQNKKNILITGASGTGKTFFADNMLAASLTSLRTAIIEDTERISSNSERFLKFSTGTLKDEPEFMALLSAVCEMKPEYILIDIKNSKFLAKVLEQSLSSSGNIILLSALNADSAMNKAFGLIQNCGYAEKYAKTAFTQAFDYIITIEKTSEGISGIGEISEVTSAKNGVPMLKNIYSFNSEISLSEDYLTPLPSEKPTLKTRFTSK